MNITTQQFRLKLLLLMLCALYCINPALAQKQGNNWYFGEKAGITFNTDPPTALSNGQLDTDEGCATISDANGQLLFYTDGVSVWDRNHTLMPNGTGLGGDTSSTQSAIIVPHPGITSQYYIFTVDNNIGSGGLSYSLVDLLENGGNGAILPDEKNVLLFAPATEKITAVQHNNGVDIWLIAHAWNSDEFYVYRLGTLGLVNEPIIQSIGSRHNGVNRNAHGYMKASPDGSLLALGIGETGICEIFDFDNQTGEISSPRRIDGYDYIYGVEFSPDNKNLFLSFRYEPDIHRFRTQFRFSEDIVNSRFIIPTQVPIGALQLGPDERIYASKRQNTLGVIVNPNAGPSEIIYEEEGFDLQGRNAVLGLPTFVQSFFKPVLFEVINTCFGSETVFIPVDPQNILTIDWNFGDPQSGVNNTSRETSPKHIFSQPGTYTVTAQVVLTNGVQREYTQEVFIQALDQEIIDLGPEDTLLCPGEFIQYDFEIEGNTRVQWMDDPGLFSPNLLIIGPGTYFIDVFTDCGPYRDSIVVRYQDFGKQPPSLLWCPGDTVTLDATTPGALSYTWSTGSTDSSIVVTEAGEYSVTIPTTSGCDLEKVAVLDSFPDRIDLPDTVRLCRGESFPLADPSLLLYRNFFDLDFIWSTGSTDPIIVVENPVDNNVRRSENIVLVTGLDNFRCFALNVIYVEYLTEDPPEINIPEVLTYCPDDTAVIDGTTPGGTIYDWFPVSEDGEFGSSISTEPILKVNSPGKYGLVVTGEFCSSIAFVEVIEDRLPIVFVSSRELCDEPGADTYISVFAANDSDPANPITYLWEDGSTDSFRRIDTVGTYQVTVTNKCGSVTQDVSIRLNTTPPPTVELGPDTTLCEGETLVLDVQQPSFGYSYRWQDRSSSRQYTISRPGQYHVRISNGCDFVRDTINVAYRRVPEVEFNDEEYLCDGNSVILNASSPDASYEWRDEANNLISQDSSILVSKPGKYKVKITDVCFEVEYEALVLPIDNAFDLGDDVELCQADSLILGVPTLQGVTYLWQDSSRQSNFTVRESGLYWLEIAQEGCTYRDSIQINLLSRLNLNLGPDQSLCPGDSLALEIGLVPGRYMWYNEADQLISQDSLLWVTQPGTYRLAFDNGCRQGGDTIQITGLPFTLGLGPDLITCQSQSQTLDATIAQDSISYLWNTGANTPMITVDTAGLYWVDVQYQSCTLRDTVLVAFLEDWVLDLGPDTLLCPQDIYVLAPANPSPQAIYQWSDGSSGPVLNVQQAGTYWVNVQDNCTNQTDTIQISFRNSPQVDLGGEFLLCPQEVRVLDVQDTDPTITYLWNDGSTRPQLSISQGGTYWVEKSDGICSVRDSVIVGEEPPIPGINLGADTTLCPGTQLQLQVGIAGRDLDYLWSDGSSDSLFLIQSPGTYTVAVSNFCETQYDTIVIDYFEFPQVDLGADTLLCPEDILILDAQNPVGATYAWNVDGQSAPQLQVSTAGIYWVDVTVGTCTFRDSIRVDYKTVLELDLGPDLNICAGDSLVLVAQNPFTTYQWQGEPSINEPEFVVTEPGTYWVVIDNGCETLSDTVRVGFVPRPIVNLGNDTTLCFQETLLLSAENGDDVVYRWSDGSEGPQLLVSQAGIYSVEVQRADCIIFDEIEVIFTECFEDLLPYNVITPNGDGLNENFEIPKLDLSQWTFQIFNRHGNEVYKSDNYQNDWTCRNHPQGVYFYILKNKANGQQLKGWIKVMK